MLSAFSVPKSPPQVVISPLIQIFPASSDVMPRASSCSTRGFSALRVPTTASIVTGTKNAPSSSSGCRASRESMAMSAAPVSMSVIPLPAPPACTSNVTPGCSSAYASVQSVTIGNRANAPEMLIATRSSVCAAEGDAPGCTTAFEQAETANNAQMHNNILRNTLIQASFQCWFCVPIDSLTASLPANGYKKGAVKVTKW